MHSQRRLPWNDCIAYNKLEDILEKQRVHVCMDLCGDLESIMQEYSPDIASKFPANSFQRIFQRKLRDWLHPFHGVSSRFLSQCRWDVRKTSSTASTLVRVSLMGSWTQGTYTLISWSMCSLSLEDPQTDPQAKSVFTIIMVRGLFNLCPFPSPESSFYNDPSGMLLYFSLSSH